MRRLAPVMLVVTLATLTVVQQACGFACAGPPAPTAEVRPPACHAPTASDPAPVPAQRTDPCDHAHRFEGIVSAGKEIRPALQPCAFPAILYLPQGAASVPPESEVRRASSSFGFRLSSPVLRL